MKNGAAKRLAPKRWAPYPQPPRRSTLTLGTKEGRTATLDDAPDVPAASAWLPLTIVDCELLREVAELPVGAGEIAQGGPARCDGFLDHVMDCGHEALQPFHGNRSPGAARV